MASAAIAIIEVLPVQYGGGDQARSADIAKSIIRSNPDLKGAMKAINGEELPKVIDTGFYWYGKSNIDDPIIKAVLYE